MNTAPAVALASSLLGCLETHCETTYKSAEHHRGGPIASGQELIAVLWFQGVDVTSSVAALVSPTGVVSKPIAIPPMFGYSLTLSTTGHSSAMWLTQPNEGGLAGAVLGEPGLTSFTLADVGADLGWIDGASIVFDGHSYQVFWLDADRLRHREVSEQGVLGDEHDLGAVPNSDGASVFAVTDRAGAVYVVVAAEPTRVLAFDTSSATTQELSSSDPEEFTIAYWLDGEIHLRHDVWTDVIESFDPATKVWRTQPMPAELDKLQLLPTATGVYVADYDLIYELDANLAVIAKYPIPDGPVGTFGSDWLVNGVVGVDSTTLTPGRVQLTRGAASGDVVWKSDVVVDSPVVVGQSCGYDQPAESWNPGE